MAVTKILDGVDLQFSDRSSGNCWTPSKQVPVEILEMSKEWKACYKNYSDGSRTESDGEVQEMNTRDRERQTDEWKRDINMDYFEKSVLKVKLEFDDVFKSLVVYGCQIFSEMKILDSKQQVNGEQLCGSVQKTWCPYWFADGV